MPTRTASLGNTRWNHFFLLPLGFPFDAACESPIGEGSLEDGEFSDVLPSSSVVDPLPGELSDLELSGGSLSAISAEGRCCLLELLQMEAITAVRTSDVVT